MLNVLTAFSSYTSEFRNTVCQTFRELKTRIITYTNSVNKICKINDYLISSCSYLATTTFSDLQQLHKTSTLLPYPGNDQRKEQNNE